MDIAAADFTSNKGVLGDILDVTDKVLAASYRTFFNHALPKGVRASLEISGRNPLSS